MIMRKIILKIVLVLGAFDGWAMDKSGFNWYESLLPKDRAAQEVEQREFEQNKKKLEKHFAEYAEAKPDPYFEEYEGVMLNPLELAIAKIKKHLKIPGISSSDVKVRRGVCRMAASAFVCQRVMKTIGTDEEALHLDLLRAMLNSGKPPWSFFMQNLERGLTPFHWACRIEQNPAGKSASLLISLLQQDKIIPYIYVTDQYAGYGHKYGATPLHQAIRTDNDTTFYLMLLFILKDYQNNDQVLYVLDAEDNTLALRDLLNACDKEHALKITTAANALIKFLAELKNDLNNDEDLVRNAASWDENQKHMWQALVHLDDAKRLDRLGFNDERLETLLSQKINRIREVLKNL